jgi:hypothetical protein
VYYNISGRRRDNWIPELSGNGPYSQSPGKIYAPVGRLIPDPIPGPTALPEREDKQSGCARLTGTWEYIRFQEVLYRVHNGPLWTMVPMIHPDLSTLSSGSLDTSSSRGV